MEFDVGAYTGPGAAAMEQARNDEGELWVMYRRLLNTRIVWQDVFRRKAAEEATRDVRWRELAARQESALGRTEQDISGNLPVGALAEWANGAGGRIRHKAILVGAVIALEEARRSVVNSENISAACLATQAEGLMERAEGQLASAAACAPSPREALIAMMLQMRIAELRGRPNECASLRASILQHAEWHGITESAGVTREMREYVMRGGVGP